MTDHYYTLAEMRAIIDAEKCAMSPWLNWCYRHRYWLRDEQCAARPDVADVAEQLLATVERVEKLADEYDRDARREGYGGELWSTTAAAIRDAINGEEVDSRVGLG